MFEEIKGILLLKRFFKAIKGDKYFHPFPFNLKTIVKVLKSKEDIYRFTFFNNEIVGMWMLRGWEEGYKIPSFGMIVHPDFRSRGVGSNMLKMAIKACEKLKCKKIRLTVDKGNPAKRLYLREGFKFKGNVGIKTL